MSPFGTRGAADELARLLDSGAPAGTAPGLALAAQLRSTGLALEAAVAPRAEFRSALRMRLLAVATVQAASPAAAAVPAPTRALEAAVSWRRRAGAVAAGAMASVVAVSGVAVAGSQSLPGDPFYGVKKTAEAFQLSTADGDLEKGTRHLDFAATRLREVRGLTLGRDAVDAGPVLGPTALSSGITLSSASQPLAAGSALSPAVAERVRETLAEMDAQTRDGSELLTQAYRSSRAPEPLRALSRFTTRQSAGLQELLPALPPATQPSARASLALLTTLGDTTDELLGIGTCASACDPSSAAPTLPPPAGSDPAGPSGTADCECPEPAPAPQPQTTATPSPQPGGSQTEQPSSPTSPEPQPTPSSSSPEPLPVPTMPAPLPTLPVPVPSLPVPVPTITLPPAPDVVVPLVDGLTGPPLDGKARRGGGTPEPEPAPTPVPQLAPAPPRP